MPVSGRHYPRRQKRSANASVARTSASTVAGSLALWPEVTISSFASGQALARSQALRGGR